MNRTQLLVLGFVAAAVVSLVPLTILAPEILESTLKPLPRWTVFIFLGGLVALLGLLGLGAWHRWRWTFWLVTVAFILGVLRVPASALELSGLLPQAQPEWYVVVQGLIGVIQFTIGILMLRGYRRAGPWGAF